MRAECQSRVDSVCPWKVLILDTKSRTDTSNNDSTVYSSQDIRGSPFILDVLRYERENRMEAEDDTFDMSEYEDDEEDEVNIFLDANLSQSPNELMLREDVTNTIKSGIKEGIGKRKMKEEIFTSITKKGVLNLEASALNEEVRVDLHPKALFLEMIIFMITRV